MRRLCVLATLAVALGQLRNVTIDNTKPRVDINGMIVDAHDGTVQVPLRCPLRAPGSAGRGARK